MSAVLAVLPIVAAIYLAIAKVRPERVHRFERRYGLMPDDGRRQVVRYLEHTRQWRAYGVAVGYAAVLLGTSSAERVTLPVTAAVAGWLGGAVLAEMRFPATGGGRVVAGWLRRVPVVLAASAAAGSVLLLLLGGTWAVLAWGVGAVVCAGAIALALQHIDGRPPSDAAVDVAISRHSASSIAGVGTALALACLGSAIAVVGDAYFDATGSAVALVGTLCALGGVALGWRLAHASRLPLRSVSAFVVLLLVATATVVGWAQWRDRTPYPASALNATATIRLTDEKAFDHDVRALGGSTSVAYEKAAGQTFVGRVDYRVPADAEGDFYAVVIDKRQHRVAQHIFGGEASSWSSTLAALPERFPWLSAMATRQVDGGYRDAGMAVSARASSPGPLTFVGSFPGAGLSAEDLMVALIFIGSDGQTYWAERLAG